MNISVTAVVLGRGIDSDATDIQGYGADKIIIVDDPLFSSYDSDVYVQALEKVVDQVSPAVILCGGSAYGKEVCARLSAKLSIGMVSDCTAIEPADDTVVYTRPTFGGKLNAKLVLDSRPGMATLRPNVFDIIKGDTQAEVQVLSLSLEKGRCELIEQKLSKAEAADLTEADIVVAGGRGTNGDFAPIENLAGLLNGAVAASRTVIDEGWRPHSDQVGQTGVVVTPNLYIACGISGAVQHFAGMSGSKTIVAVNKDAGAPIFTKSDYGIVGDLFEVVPALIDEIKAIQE
jgi:electron transfer flavoprotein alpha subunit